MPEIAGINKTTTKKGAVPKQLVAAAWKPGQSGNPSGRPKIAEELRVKAGEMTLEAFNIIVSVMRDETAMPGTRVQAAEKVIRLAGAWPSDKAPETSTPATVPLTTEQMLLLLKKA